MFGFSKKVTAFFLILFLFFFLYAVSVFYHFFRAPLVNRSVVLSVKVYPNQRIHTLCTRLYQAKIIQHPWLFQWLIDITGNRLKLHFGEYQIQYPMTTWDLLQNIVKGTGLMQHRFAIINGWRFSDIRDALLKNADLNSTLVNQSNHFIMQLLQSSKENPEGLFYPDTYFFTWGNTDFSILQTAYTEMQTILQKNWQARAPDLLYQNSYQALIVASLIERETPVDAEKPVIASVILNRLKKHMRLQIDPTVLYGLHKSYGAEITKTDLKTNTPYNTYLIDGLPPTPICMPGKMAIYAALHPAKTDYLYYVATGDGGHQFSKTYAEHLQQVKKYRKRVSESRGGSE